MAISPEDRPAAQASFRQLRQEIEGRYGDRLIRKALGEPEPDPPPSPPSPAPPKA